ncbi:transposase, partial [Escherichia coli]|nr:transposase [Escherichia coli]EEW8228742.1 transposase [Escherichia coli]EEX0439725.1 transposase [Escherichia coli]EGD4834154.1 transposase [Escherichia coli]EGD5179150.1 transposase [Escherichia coli]
ITDAQLFYCFVSSKIVNPIKTTIIGS